MDERELWKHLTPEQRRELRTIRDEHHAYTALWWMMVGVLVIGLLVLRCV